MFTGLFMGIGLISPENSGLYGVTAVFLVTISDFMQWVLRQMILWNSLMASAQRILHFRDFKAEK